MAKKGGLSDELFGNPVVEPSLKPRPATITSHAPSVASSPVILSKPTERERKKQTFEFYQDQLDTLSSKTMLYFLRQGQRKSLVGMIREAIDEYINKYK